MLIITNDSFNWERSSIRIKGSNTYTNKRKIHRAVNVGDIFATKFKEYNKKLKI